MRFTPIPSDSPKQVKKKPTGPIFDPNLGLSTVYQSAKKLDDNFLFGEEIQLKEDVVDQIYNSYMNFQANTRYQSTGIKHKPACQITKFAHNHTNKELVHPSVKKSMIDQLSLQDKRDLAELKAIEMQKYRDSIDKLYTVEKNSSTMISKKNHELRNSIMKRFSLSQIRGRSCRSFSGRRDRGFSMKGKNISQRFKSRLLVSRVLLYQTSILQLIGRVTLSSQPLI